MLLFWIALGEPPTFMVTIYNAIISAMNNLISWVGAQEQFVFANISFDGFQLFCAYGCIASFLIWQTYLTKKWRFTFLSLLAAFLLWTGYQTWSSNSRSALVLAHQYKKSMLLYKNGEKLTVYSNDSLSITNSLVKQFSVGERIKVQSKAALENYYRYKNKTLAIIDKSGIYNTTKQIMCC